MILFLTILVILFLIIICILAYYLYINVLKQESLETTNIEVFEMVNTVYDRLLDVEVQLHQIDINGAFEANDQVGFVFQEIKNMIMELNITRNE